MDEIYFLVKGTLHTTHYESKTRTEEVIRLVQAATSDDAETKFEEHFESRTREYDVYYRVSGIEVLPTII